MLLAAIGGCTAIDVDILTSRRAEPEAFEVLVDANKVRGADGNHLTDTEVTFRIVFPGSEHGDAARALLPDVVKKSHDRRSAAPSRSPLPSLPGSSSDGPAADDRPAAKAVMTSPRR
ncbi:MAG TPA: hypothetical protein VK162_06345 [Streptosporangiaceae bacterium]|nr:hypothetical protein [Streptosporangiaceae bacterium]